MATHHGEFPRKKTREMILQSDDDEDEEQKTAIRQMREDYQDGFDPSKEMDQRPTASPSKYPRGRDEETEKLRTELQLVEYKINDPAMQRNDLYWEAVAAHTSILEVVVRDKRLLRASQGKNALLLRDYQQLQRENEDLRRRVKELEEEKEIAVASAVWAMDENIEEQRPVPEAEEMVEEQEP